MERVERGGCKGSVARAVILKTCCNLNQILIPEFREEGRVDKACHSRLARNGKTAFHPSWDGVLALARDRCSCGRSCAGCSVSQRGACTPLVSQGLPSGSSPAPAPESLQEHRAHLNTVRCQSPRRRVCLRESSCEGKRQHTFLRVLMLSLSGGCLSTQVACAPW